MNVGVLGLGHLGTMTAARVTSNGYDAWWDHAGLFKVDETLAVATWQRRVWATQPDRGLVYAIVDG